MGISDELLGNFVRIVRSGGGEIHSLGEDNDTIRIGFVPGDLEPCESGACVLPHLELQDMMGEWLARRAPGKSVRVVIVKPPECEA